MSPGLSDPKIVPLLC